MQGADFDKVKEETEAELGREIDADEERHLRALYFFAKGCQLKAQTVERATANVK